MDWSKLSDSDLQALAKGDITAVSDAGLALLSATEEAPEPMTVADRVKRQAGLAGRNILEGAPGLMDLATAVPYWGIEKATGYKVPTLRDLATRVSDYAGLPKPESTAEKIGAGIMQTGAGAGGGIAAAQKLAAMSPKLAPYMKSFTQDPSAQMVAAGAAGAAAPAAEEAGFGTGGQIGASVLAALAAPGAVSQTVKRAKDLYSKVPAFTPYSDDALRVMFQQKGVDLQGINVAGRNQIMEDARNALKMGGELDTDALKRLVEFRRVGATPTRGTVTLDPMDVTREKNVMKIQANIGARGDESLPMIASQNEQRLIAEMNRLGADESLGMASTGERLIKSVTDRDELLQAQQKTLYDKAKALAGRDVELDRSVFVNRLDQLLAENNKGAFLPKEIRRMVNEIAKGETKVSGQTVRHPFTVDTIDQLKTTIATAQRATADGNIKQALSFVRQAIDDTPLVGASEEAMAAFNKARDFSKGRFDWQKSAPGIKASLDDAIPDTFVEKFILAKGAGRTDVENLLKEVAHEPAALQSARNQVMSWLKGQALGLADDEVGIFSARMFDKAVKKVGEDKLKLLFTPDELRQLESVRKVSAYMKVQPPGSAVNVSNTASNMIGQFFNFMSQKAGPMLPAGRQVISDPIENIAGQLGSYRSRQMPQAITKPMEAQPSSMRNMLWPGLLMTQPSE